MNRGRRTHRRRCRAERDPRRRCSPQRPAYQAKHPHAIINDEMAIALVDAIDFDFDKFGRTGQEMA